MPAATFVLLSTHMSELSMLSLQVQEASQSSGMMMDMQLGPPNSSSQHLNALLLQFSNTVLSDSSGPKQQCTTSLDFALLMPRRTCHLLG